MNMKIGAGEIFPPITVARSGGGEMALGTPAEGFDWRMVIVYRGKHCPLCAKYLKGLEGIRPLFEDNGIDIVAVSGDPEDKAAAFVADTGTTVPVGYGLTLDQMADLGLYISEPRSAKETDRPFPEPGLFVVRGDGKVQIVDISNAPFARPDLEALGNGLKFVRENDYSIRGTRTD